MTRPILPALATQLPCHDLYLVASPAGRPCHDYIFAREIRIMTRRNNDIMTRDALLGAIWSLEVGAWSLELGHFELGVLLPLVTWRLGVGAWSLDHTCATVRVLVVYRRN